MSFTISRTRWIQAARIQGTIPAAACPTAMAPYMSGRPPTSDTATFPGRPRRLSTGEYSPSTAKAARPTSTAVPLTKAAAPTPITAPLATHRSAVPRVTRPPARTPAAASSKLLIRTSRSRSVTQHVLVQLLVARHDAVGRELERAAGGGGAHPGVEGTIAQHAKALRDHGRDIPLGREESRLTGHHHLGEAAHGGRDDRYGARHRLERGEAERFRLARQQEQVAASQDLGDVVHLAEEADVAS